MAKIIESSTSSTSRTRLILARYKRSWSQQEVADRLGTTPLNVSRWERRLTSPSPYFRHRLVELFGSDEIEQDLLPPDPMLEALQPTTAEVIDESTTIARYDTAIPRLPFSLPLVGRLEEMEQLKDRLLQSQKEPLLALSGLPGVGKTALAATLVHDPQVREVFVDGILWATLGPSAEIQTILSRWGHLLGVSASEARELTSVEAWAALLRKRIGARRMLLVLDDAWKVEDVIGCQVGGVCCSYLLTTRSPLLARRFTLDGFFAVNELDEKSGNQLMGLLAAEAMYFEPERVRELVRQMGGLPLALTLIGNYLRLQSYNGQPRRIRAALDELSCAQRRLQISWFSSPLESISMYSMAASLQEAIMTSERYLPKEARTALYALSLFTPRPGSFTEEAALAVCQQSAQALDVLSDAGLLESVEVGRYTLHPTVVDYARSQLTDRAPKERLARYGISYASLHHNDYEALELESSMLEAALRSACELGEWEELVRGVQTLTPFWQDMDSMSRLKLISRVS